MEMAKKAKKGLRLGKSDGPAIYTKVNDVKGLGLNKREKEALNLNYGSLVVPGLSTHVAEWLMHDIFQKDFTYHRTHTPTSLRTISCHIGSES